MKLKNKIALITGGGTGIGKATAFLFAKEGARVVITGRREQILLETAAEAKTENLEIEYLVSDVSKEEDCKAAVDYTVSKFGRIDILFNNAGVSYMGVTHETSTELWDKTFDINVKGIYLMSKYAIPYMTEEKSGCIVNNSSILGLKASRAGFAAYSSSKYTPMMDDLFDEWDDREAGEKRYISVHPIGRLAQPEEIAHAVLFLCDDNIKFMTGTMLSVDGGMSAK